MGVLPATVSTHKETLAGWVKINIVKKVKTIVVKLNIHRENKKIMSKESV